MIVPIGLDKRAKMFNHDKFENVLVFSFIEFRSSEPSINRVFCHKIDAYFSQRKLIVLHDDAL